MRWSDEPEGRDAGVNEGSCRWTGGAGLPGTPFFLPSFARVHTSIRFFGTGREGSEVKSAAQGQAAVTRCGLGFRPSIGAPKVFLFERRSRVLQTLEQ